MRALSYSMLGAILLSALSYCTPPIDEEFGGFEPATLARLLTADTAKAWRRISRTVNGEAEEVRTGCTRDDLWVFRLGSANTDSALYRYSQDSIWCVTTYDTLYVDSTLTDSGWVDMTDTVAVPREEPLEYSWKIGELSSNRQVTTDTIFVFTDSTRSLRRLFDQSTLFFSWFYWEPNATGSDSNRIEESYEVVPLEDVPGLNDEG